MGRRVYKEFKAPEVLALIEADRDGHALDCPYCSKASIVRTPPRSKSEESVGRVVLRCTGCNRRVSFVEKAIAEVREHSWI